MATTALAAVHSASDTHYTIGEHKHKPPGHNPLGLGQNRTDETPGHKPQVRTTCRIRTQCTMSFYVTVKRVRFWKLNFRIGGRKTPDITPGFRTSGLCPGVYVRQSWNLAFKSAMCDSVGFIRPCHWKGDSDLTGLCPGGYVRSPHYTTRAADAVNLKR